MGARNREVISVRFEMVVSFWVVWNNSLDKSVFISKPIVLKEKKKCRNYTKPPTNTQIPPRSPIRPDTPFYPPLQALIHQVPAKRQTQNQMSI